MEGYVISSVIEELRGLYEPLLRELEPYLSQGYIRGVAEPRLTAALAIDGDIVDFEYSGRMVHPHPIKNMPLARKIVEKVSQFCGENSLPECNGVYVNWYRSPEDSIGWHSDQETSAEKFYVISLTLNESVDRTFYFRRKSDKKVFKRDLQDGEIMAMLPGCQQAFQHSLPRLKKNLKKQTVEGGRLNLTFRCFRVQGKTT